MGIDLKRRLKEAIDTFVQKKLESAPAHKEVLVKFILNQTRVNVSRIIDTAVGNENSIEQLDRVCQALDASPITFDGKVLETAGIPHLTKEIAAYRHEVRWQILMEELKNSIPADGTFSPETIQHANKALYQGLRAALKQNSDALDWESLRSKLPPDLQSRYEIKKLSKEERRRKIEEDTMQLIETFGLTDVVGGPLGKDPKKLAYYLLFSNGLTDEQKERIIYVSFAGLREGGMRAKLTRLLEEYEQKLNSIEVLSEIPSETEDDCIRITVRVPAGAERLLIRGASKEDIQLNGEREITFDVPLERGETNTVQLLAYNNEEKTRSGLHTLYIKQKSEKADTDTLVDFLNALKEATLQEITKDKTKKILFKKCLEESLIKQFSANFETGRRYAEDLIAQQKHAFVKKCLGEIVELFGEIDAKDYPFIREDEGLMFFQKYCIYKLQEQRAAGNKAAILANEPGLGKTLNALTLVYDDESLIICPNSAASTWIEQEAKFFREPFLLLLSGKPYAERKKLLKERKTRGVVTNVEFVRHRGEEKKEEADKENEKIELLNQRKHPRKKKALIIDEAHFLKGDSQQTQGIARLESDFTLLLTASPYRTTTALCKVMGRIFPDDPRFKDMDAFAEAFPMNDPKSLRALHAMMRPHIVRFLKDEVIPTYKPGIPLEKQPLSLPAKKYIDPYETGVGLFELTPVQEEAILEMFQNWNQWTQKYERYMPKDEQAYIDGIRTTDNHLTKEHALRQIVNDPRYINAPEESPKHKAAMEIVRKELVGGNKGVIFCRYHEEVKAYAELLKKAGIDFSMYTGEVTKKGTKKEASGKDILYAIDQFGNYKMDAQGNPQAAQKKEPGRPMLEMDYERLTFQNNPQKKIMLATMSAGSQSVTFTAGNFIIFDDQPKDYIEKYQAEDRIHRIDEKRPKYEARYYTLASKYSKAFLEKTKKIYTERTTFNGRQEKITAYEKWFEQGTWDAVHIANLKSQQKGFELLNNGIPSDPALMEEERSFVI